MFGLGGNLDLEYLRIVEVFLDHAWIEPSEVVEESFLIPLPSDPATVAFEFSPACCIKATFLGGIEWNARAVLTVP